MTKKKSKKKIRKKQKSIKDGFEQDQEEQEKENPKKDAPAQKSEQRSGANRTRKSEAGSRKNSRAVKCPHAQKKTENSRKKNLRNSPFYYLTGANYEVIIQYRAVQQMGHKISNCFFSAIVAFQLQR